MPTLFASRQHKRKLRSFTTPIILTPKLVGFLLALFLLAFVTHVRETRILVAIEAESSSEVGIFGHIFKMTKRDDKWSIWHSANDQKPARALARDDVMCEWTEFRPFWKPPEYYTHVHIPRGH